MADQPTHLLQCAACILFLIRVLRRRNYEEIAEGIEELLEEFDLDLTPEE